jgi:zinc/manganese transport system ATP-binding protein
MVNTDPVTFVGEPLLGDGAGGGVPDPVLRVEEVSVSLGGRRVLDQVSFSVEAGGFCGLIGSNGAGKTTLLRVILGLIAPSSGRIVVAGGARSRRSPQIGYVPQKIVLEADMPLRARDLVGLGLDGHRFGIARCSRRSGRPGSRTPGSGPCQVGNSSGS